MNALDQQFHIQQARLQTRKSGRGVKAQKVVAPLFTADVLCGDDPQDNVDRLIAYAQKRKGMKLPTITEAVSSVRVKRLVPVRVKERAA